MRVLVVGANGLIGSAVAARLVAQGHEVVAATRRRLPIPSPLLTTEVVIDVARAVDPADWSAHLLGIDAVVNAAGVLQDSPRDSTAGAHSDGIAALFRACEQAGVRRVVHLSALGVDRHASTAFSRTKLAGDELLMSCDLDWIILRPSVVIGRPAYGGSALIRGLAALPFLPLVPGTGALEIVHLDDLVDAVVFFLKPDAPTRHAIEIAGPRRWQLDDVIRLFRKWLRFAPAQGFRVPDWASSAMFRLGDMVSLLGWRPPMRSTALREIMRGSTGDASGWARLTGINPRDLETALAAEPASVQERWFARLYLLKPVVFGLLSLFWIVTGLISLGPGYGIGKRLMEEAGAGELAGASVIAGALADITIGLGIVIRPLARVALFAALGGSLLYAVGGTILLPRLWADPLGGLLKIAPIIALNLVALAILDDR
jgi:uncharacterized protein YbjT (DUF2867 family)